MIESVNLQEFLIFILVFVRLITFIAYVPLFFPSGVPQRYKIGLALILTLIMTPIVGKNIIEINNIMIFIMLILKEIVVGLLLGFITTIVFQIAQMAGQFLDFQVSFSMSAVFDPLSNETATILGRFFYMLCMSVFLLIDGHHLVITSLAESFNIVGIGALNFKTEIFTYMIHIVIEFFTIGFKMVVPIIFIIILTDFTLGLVARIMPQLNIMMLGIPIKIMLGLLTVSLSVPVFMKMLVNNLDQMTEAIRGVLDIMPCVLIFFANEGGEKTEEATPKKKSDARKKGQVAKSKELTSAIGLLGITAAAMFALEGVLSGLKETLIAFLSNYTNTSINMVSIFEILKIVVIKILIMFLPVALPIMVMGIIANVAQVGKLFTTEPLKPKLEKINPLSGLKNMFSMKAVIDLLKNLIIIIIIGYVGYKFIKTNYYSMLNFTNLRIFALTSALGDLVIDILKKVSLVMLIVGIIDYAYQRYKFNKDLKMTKQEVKEEFKQQEGDPIVKGKRKQKQREMAMRRMMQDIPDATVVITNPTHIAIALKYEENSGKAPKVIGKGADNIAIKIKEIAKDNDIPIIENKELARLIYKEIEVDMEIPYNMYKAVAEILAIVYKMKK
ncbi:MAG: fused FliR family export protein/FlhB family type III secretion system protein [Clostridium sp.]